MLTRRSMLRVVAGGAAASVPFLFSRAEAAAALPVTIANNTGQFPNSAITMYVVGTDLASGQMGYVKNAGQFTPVTMADNGPDGFADLGVPLSTVGSSSFALPKMSGRIYFAIEGRLKFKVVVDGNGRPALQYPVAWTEGDPNFDVLHDCCEFTYSDAGMFCNTTQVDMFSIPMSIRLSGSSGDKLAGDPAAGSRNKIFDEMKQQPGFEKLVIGNNLRIIAPGHAIGMGRFSADYFDGYIGEIWDRYAGTDLRVSTLQGSFTGRVSGGQLVFSGAVRPFARPTTANVLFCDGALLAPNDGLSGPVAAVLGAGFNRSVLGNPDQPTTDPAAFYQGAVTNHYSRLMHKYANDGMAYGFPFDDVTEKASYTQDSAPQQLIVTLTPFGGGVGEAGVPSVPDGTSAPIAPIVVAPKVRNAYDQLPADGYSAERGTTTQASSGGGRHLGGIGNGDWVCYAGVDFGAKPATQFKVRVASGAATGVSGLIEVRLDDPTGPVLGSVSVAGTGGWENWRVVPGNLAKVTGNHDVYLTFTSAQPQDYVNLSWVQFAE